MGGERITKVKEKVIDEETQDEKEVRRFKRTGPEPTTRFAYPLPRELCILWRSEGIAPMLIAQHTHDSRYRTPHFPDATELPLSGFLAERLGDRIKMVAEAETEGSLENNNDATE